MANRQDSGSNSQHENQRPNPHSEDALPEMTDNTRGLGEDDEAEDLDDELMDEEDEEANF